MLTDIFAKNAAKYKDQPAFRFVMNDRTERQISYDQFNKQINRLASGMKKLGVAIGSRVALLLPNCVETLVSYGAAEKGAFVAVPLNIRLHPDELGYIIQNSDAAAVIFHEQLAHLIKPIQAQLSQVKWWIAVGDDVPGMLSYNTICTQGSDEDYCASITAPLTESDLVYLMYTSGTTGKPKGVMVPHRVPRENAKTFLIELNTRPGYRAIFTIPLYHIGGKSLAFNMFSRGGTNIILDKYDPELILDIISRDGVEILSAVPTMFQTLIQSQREKPRDLPALKTIFYSGSPAMEVKLQEMMKTFGNILFQVYGMTETGPTITVLHPEDHTENNGSYLLSCGKPAYGVQVKIVDHIHETLNADRIGEIAVKSDQLLSGYWKNEQATSQALRDGWFFTGDIGKIDEQGYLYLLDRKKDMIVTGGENVYPREVEEVLSSHPSIDQVAAFGIPDERWGETVKAAVVLKKGHHLTPAEVIDYAKQHLASYKKPTSVDFVESLPTNASGKILKHVLRAKYWEGQNRLVN